MGLSTAALWECKFDSWTAWECVTFLSPETEGLDSISLLMSVPSKFSVKISILLVFFSEVSFCDGVHVFVI